MWPALIASMLFEMVIPWLGVVILHVSHVCVIERSGFAGSSFCFNTVNL